MDDATRRRRAASRRTAAGSRRREVAATAVLLTLAGVLWLVLLHRALGAHEAREPSLAVHWLRDAALALPVVSAAVWAARVLADRLGFDRQRRPLLAALALAAVVSWVLAAGSPVHALLFAPGGHATTGEPPLALHVLRDALLALPPVFVGARVALAAGAWMRSIGRRGLPIPARRDVGLTRRRVVEAGMVGGAVLLLPFEWVRVAASRDFSSPVATPFALPLPVPVPSVATARGDTDFHAFTARVGESQIFPTGPRTRIWGYEGVSPAPTILAESDRPVVATFVNGLAGEREPDGEPVSLSTHLHGGHQSAADDGYPTDSPTTGFAALIAPGASRDYHYPNRAEGRGEPGRNLWFHDHTMDVTAFNVYQGLAGLYLLHDPREDALDLPGTGADAMADHGYGVVDLPLLLQDRLFRADHSLFFPHEPDGVLGDTFLVNGAIQPLLADTPRRKVRLRIYNGSNRRWYNLALSSGQPFVQVGTEAGLLPAPVTRATILLAPAERADVVVDFTTAPNTVDLLTLPAGLPEADVKVALLRFEVAANRSTDRSRVPDRLRAFGPIPPAVRRREFRFDRSGGEWTVDNERFDPDRPVARPGLDTVEEWTFVNKSGGWVHPIHVHDVPMRVVTRNGRPPPPWERGERDTVPLGHGESVTVRLRFVDFTGAYVLHCHNTDHEDMRMMARFDVVA